MKNKIVIGLVAVAVLLIPLQAVAAPAQVFHDPSAGSTADAFWFTRVSDTRVVITVVRANQSRTGQSLAAFQIAFDSNTDTGEVFGITTTSAEVASGFSSSISPRLTSARASGADLPATTCDYDGEFNLIGCENTTIGVSVSWTGLGSTHQSTTQIFQEDGVKLVFYSPGISRNASATGIVGDLTLGESDPENTAMGITRAAGEVVICFGNDC